MSGDPIAAVIDSARAAERVGEWGRALELYGDALRVADSGRGPDILRWTGTVHRERGDLEAAMELYEASLASARAQDLHESVAAGLNCMGIVEQLRGRLTEAEAMYEGAATIADRLRNVQLGAMISQNLATLANIRGEVELALRHYGRARESFRQLGDDLAAAWVLNNMGMGYVDLRAWELAQTCFSEAHDLATQQGDQSTRALIVINMAEMCLRSRAFVAARTHCDEAFELFTRLGSRSGVAEADKIYGMLYRDTTRPALAETHFGRSVDAARAIPDPLLEAETLQEWALLHGEMERNQDAFRCLNAAHRRFSELGARRELLDLDRRLTQIEEIYIRVVQAWGESIEAKDRYTAGHCGRVAEYACALAADLGIEGRELRWFRMGAFLHDVGKIEVPEYVLNKAGKLTEEEWATMKDHTVAGERITAELGFPWDIGPMVRSHHERWDGTGYPDGLAGEEIPAHARILCVADVYDALTTTRSYRAALSKERALEIMSEESGRLLDPELFARFCEIMASLPEPTPPTLAAR